MKVFWDQNEYSKIVAIDGRWYVGGIWIKIVSKIIIFNILFEIISHNIFIQF